MHPLLRLVVGIGLMAALLVGVAFALPQNVTVARSMVMNAPESDVFPYANNPRKFNQWSPWAAKDPEAQYTFSGPPQGLGAKMAWKSDHPDVGSGTQEIVESEQNRFVKVALDFGEMGKGNASLDLQPSGAGTKVVWVFNTDVGNNPLQRWMGLMFDRWVGEDYEAGLQNLKKIVESGG